MKNRDQLPFRAFVLTSFLLLRAAFSLLIGLDGLKKELRDRHSSSWEP